MPSSFTRVAAKATGITVASAVGAALALAGLNKLISQTAPTPQAPLSVEPQKYVWSGEDCSYSVKGQGQAVVLLHGIYAGASSFEFRRAFPLLARQFRVFAPDLPGCGLSARPAAVYHPDRYISFIRDFVREVAGGADQPVHLIASSLSSAFAITAVASRPDLFDRLVLIEPTGIDQLSLPPHAGQRFLGKVLRSPLVGMSLYHALVSRAGLRYFLAQQVYHDKSEVTDDLIDAYYAVAHQPNARYAASSFIGGSLNLDIADEFEMIERPTLLCWGRKAAQSPIECAEAFLERNDWAELAIFDHSGSLPHDEEADDFVLQVTQWLRASISSSRY
jgi:pimeloyl-ACP methyl ester carboxylesterase